MRQLILTLVISLLSPMVYCMPVFEILPLGVYGGLKDGNLSAYLLKPIASKNYIALDAGTLVHGLEKAVLKNALPNTSVELLLQKQIPTYLISHAHLDHLMGLLMAQPELRAQQAIMMREETMNALQKHIFTWAIWGNFGDGGEIPHLNFQHYQTLPLHQWVAVPNTELQVKAFPLSHGAMASTAFLLRYQKEYLLYFGDTGADSIEKSTNLASVWKEIAPLIRNKQLHAMMLECSFVNSQPNDQLYGHLKPILMMAELRRLASIVDPGDVKNALQGLPVIVTHMKPRLVDLSHSKDDIRQLIISELSKENDLGVELIKPEQGTSLKF